MSKNKEKGQFLRLLKFIFVHNKVKCIISLIGIVATAILTVLGSFMTSILIDDYVEPLIKVANPNFTSLYKFILLMVFVYVASLISLTVYVKLMMYTSKNVLQDFRNELFIHMQKLPIRFFDKNSHGNIMSCFTNDIDTLRQVVSESLPQIINTFVSVICIFIFMFNMHVVLACITIVLLLVMLFTMKIVKNKSSVYFNVQQSTLGNLNGYINEMINGQKVIKVFCHEEETMNDFNKINEELCVNSKKADKIANMAMPLLFNIGILSYVIILIVGSLFSIKNPEALSLGTLAAFLILLRQLTNPVAQVSQQLNAIVMANAGAKRIFKMLDEDVEYDEGYVTLVNAKTNDNDELVEADEVTGTWAWKHPHSDGTTSLVRVTGDVRFFDVDFGYNDDKIVLHNVSLYAKPGQKIAFVGATGAGKTTITNLINRFYDIQDGKIRIDGININKINKPDLRRALGMVLQDTNLFTGTIKDNIRFGKLDATDEEIVAACKLANADTFINLLPDKYDTMLIDDGGNLSQGQKQLLSIARTAINNPPILILDEATSSIDTRTEGLIQEGMDKLMQGRTVLVIAHRLSTIKNSNAIMVLDQGRVIERGDHDDLISQHGTYYRLYTGAFELE